MSGHSKWATIKRAKGKTDAARGRVFSRVIREVTIAARMGGGNIEANPRLRAAVSTARAANMPKQNIENAILKGTGQLEGVILAEVTFEGYAAGGVAILVDCMTDNHNRTVAEVRHALTRFGGNMGSTNSVNWMFHTKGIIVVSKESKDEDSLMELVLEAGAEDMIVSGDDFEITTPLDQFENVRLAVEKAGIPMVSAELTKIAENQVKVAGDDVGKVLRVIDAIDELDDVQHVYSNADISDEDMEKFSAAN